MNDRAVALLTGSHYFGHMPWEPTGTPWQYVLLDRMKPSIDVSQLQENLRLTPTERLQRLEALMDFLDEVRRAGANAISKAPDDAR